MEKPIYEDTPRYNIYNDNHNTRKSKIKSMYPAQYSNNSSGNLREKEPGDFTSHGVTHTFIGIIDGSHVYISKGHGSFCPGGHFPGESW